MSKRSSVSWLVAAGLVGAVVAFAAWASVPKSAVVEVLLRAFLDERARPIEETPVLPAARASR